MRAIARSATRWRRVPWARPWAWPWPLPAVAAWSLAWLAWLAARPAIGPGPAAALALGVSAGLAWPLGPAWRRAMAAGGFPLSALAAGAAGPLPSWAWLLALGGLALAYPLRAWRDAPFFPTPAGALDALAARIPLAPGARVLDAGCGAGHGLRALRRAWPQAQVEGVEWSLPLAALARLACPWARVRRGDLWADDWRGLALVYVFQRPESMARAWAKARAELPAGAWLVSLEFVLPDRAPDLTVPGAGGRVVHAWRVPSADGSAGAAAALNPGARGPITPGNATARRAAG